MFGGTAMSTLSEDALEHRLIEEELDLQLELLKEETLESKIFPTLGQEGESTLSPEKEDPMQDLPLLKEMDRLDQMVHKAEDIVHKAEDIVHKAEVDLAREEAVLGEHSLETLAICGVVLLLALAPQLLTA
jgi:hypothetical protein